jgi:hypothetical protein
MPCFLLLLVLAGLGAVSGDVAVRAGAGADAALSIPLGDAEDGAPRILWLFCDTFVARAPARVRTEPTDALLGSGVESACR